jgi:hypothetical protein
LFKRHSILENQYINDDKGNKVLGIISIREYERILEELEELEDIHIYDKLKAAGEANEPLSDYLQKRTNPGKDES